MTVPGLSSRLAATRSLFLQLRAMCPTFLQ
jgi:hypothetical protein